MLTMLQVTADEEVASVQSFIQKEAEADGASLSEETQVASIPDFQPRDYPTGLADRGYDVYNTNCKACHGNLAKGDYGPKLQQNPILDDDNNFWKIVLKGRGGRKDSIPSRLRMSRLISRPSSHHHRSDTMHYDRSKRNDAR
jgi:mono/diheme cytochrome c family protein